MEADLRGVVLIRADLRGANLERAKLQDVLVWEAKLQKANLAYAELQNADLRRAHLEEADLFGAQLQGAKLICARLQSAELWCTNLQKANLSRCNLSVARTLEQGQFEACNVDESTVFFPQRCRLLPFREDRLPGEPSGRECLALIVREAKRVFFRFARYRKAGHPRSRAMMCECMRRIMGIVRLPDIRKWIRPPRKRVEAETEWERVHRELKQAFKDRGLYAEAGRHYYRQVVYRRRRKWGERKLHRWLCPVEWLLFDVLSGYGEKPQRTIFWIVAVVAFFTGVYAAWPELVVKGMTADGMGLWNALYFSIVTFTTLGFGPGPEGPMRIAVAIEAAVGALLIAVAMITYARLAVRD